MNEFAAVSYGYKNRSKKFQAMLDGLKLHQEKEDRKLETKRIEENTRLNPEDAQIKLKRIVAEFREGKIENAIIRAEPGLGKTTAVIDGLVKNSEERIFLYVPTHDLADELEKKIRIADPNLNGFVFKGRNRGMCHRQEAVDKSVSIGEEVSSSTCSDCEYLNTCPYNSQVKQIKDCQYVIFPHNYLTTPLSRNLLELLSVNPDSIQPAKIVIDESFWDKFLDMGREVSLQTLTDYNQQLKQGDKRVFKTDIRVTDILVDCVKNDRPLLKTLWNSGIRYENLQKIKSEYYKRLQSPRFMKFKRSNLGELFRLLSCEIDQNREDPHHVIVHGTQFYLFFKKWYVWKGKNIPTLVIDGSADKILVSRVLGNSFEYHQIKVKRKSHITQIYSKSFHTSGFSYADQVSIRDIGKINQFILGLREKDKKVLTILPKKIEHHIENSDVEHYGNIRGVDKYKDSDCLVIVGRNLPRLSSVELISRAMFGNTWNEIKFIDKSNDGRYWTLRKNYILNDDAKSDVTTLVPYHPDYRCRSILNQILEEELLQAVSRIRDIWGEGKEVYIFTNVVIDLEVDELVPWSDFISGGNKIEKLFKRMDLLNDVFTCTDSEVVCRYHKDMFKNPDLYKNELKKFKKLKGKSVYQYYIENLPSLNHYKYRPLGYKSWSGVLTYMNRSDTKKKLYDLYSREVSIRRDDFEKAS